MRRRTPRYAIIRLELLDVLALRFASHTSVPSTALAAEKAARLQHLRRLGHEPVPTRPENPKAWVISRKRLGDKDFAGDAGIAVRTGLRPDGTYLCRHVVKDTAAIVAKSLHGDAYTNGRGHFRIPSWAQTCQPVTRTAKCRPTGDRDKALGRLRRLLNRHAAGLRVEERVQHASDVLRRSCDDAVAAAYPFRPMLSHACLW